MKRTLVYLTFLLAVAPSVSAGEADVAWAHFKQGFETATSVWECEQHFHACGIKAGQLSGIEGPHFLREACKEAHPKCREQAPTRAGDRKARAAAAYKIKFMTSGSKGEYDQHLHACNVEAKQIGGQHGRALKLECEGFLHEVSRMSRAAFAGVLRDIGKAVGKELLKNARWLYQKTKDVIVVMAIEDGLARARRAYREFVEKRSVERELERGDIGALRRWDENNM